MDDMPTTKREQYEKEIDSLREAYARSRPINGPLAVLTGEGIEEMRRMNRGSAPIEASDNRGEIECLMVELQQAIDELDHTAMKVIERTADAAAMDRNIPSMGEDEVSRAPETRLGNYLFDSIHRTRHIQNRLNEHLYKLEL